MSASARADVFVGAPEHLDRAGVVRAELVLDGHVDQGESAELPRPRERACVDGSHPARLYELGDDRLGRVVGREENVEALGCEPPSVTLMTRKLEASGHIRRKRAPATSAPASSN